MLKLKDENAALVHENAASIELMKKLMADKTEYETKYMEICVIAEKLEKELQEKKV